MNQRLNIGFFLLFASVTLIPFGNDIFIAGLPAMKLAFPGQPVSLVMSMALLGLAVAQPFYGPLLDRFGRRPVLISSLMLCSLAGLLTVSTQDFTWLLIGRFFQAMGACGTIVTVLAVIRDKYPQEKIVKMTGILMGVIGVCPAIAPLLGSLINNFWGWAGSFIFLFILAVCFTLSAFFTFKETQTEKNFSALQFKHLAGNYKSLIMNKNIFSSCLVSACSYGALFSFFAISSFFIIDQLHYSMIAFGFIVAINALAIIAMSIIAPKLARQKSLTFVLVLGMLLVVLGGVLLLFCSLLFKESLLSVMLPIFIMTLGVGAIRPTASAKVMQFAPKRIAGSAAALFNFLSFIGGAICTILVAIFIKTPLEFGVIILFFGFAGLLAACYQARANQKNIPLIRN